MHFRASWLLIGLLTPLGAGLLPAQTSAPASGGIAEAQREFQTLKAAPAATNDSRLTLPKIDAPQLPSAAPATPNPLSREATIKAQKKAWKERNWLVNGVMNNRSGDKADDLSDDDDSNDPTADPFAQLIAEQAAPRDRQNREASKDADAREQKAPDALSQVPNPLADFMTGWISPQDRSLLLPTSLGDSSGANGATVPAGDFSRGNPTDFASVPGNPGGFLDIGKPNAPSDSPSNPYLAFADSGPGAPATTVFLPPSPPSAPVPVDLPALQPAPPAPVQSRNDPPPAIAKPDDAAKYFPQLKRF